MIGPATPLEDILEKDWQRQVVDLAAQLGWRRAYHTHDSRRSSSGFPDLVLVRDRVVFIECKREKTRATEAQRDWLGALVDAGAEVYIVRPRNLQAVANVLAARVPVTATSIVGALAVQVPAAFTELAAELELELGRCPYCAPDELCSRHVGTVS